jgi:hypothetical protein
MNMLTSSTRSEVPSTTWLPASFRPLNRRVEEEDGKEWRGGGWCEKGGRGWFYDLLDESARRSGAELFASSSL